MAPGRRPRRKQKEKDTEEMPVTPASSSAISVSTSSQDNVTSRIGNVYPPGCEEINLKNDISPKMLYSVLPQLEFKLKSLHESDRKSSVSLLGRLFSKKGSLLAVQYGLLWQAFLGRFNDISVQIRTKCVQYSMHLLLNQKDVRKDIVEALRSRQHDLDEGVRLEVVKAVVATAKHEFEIVSANPELLNFVRERTRDKKFKIRKEALQGLARIYKKYLDEDKMVAAPSWMKDAILHVYYMPSLDDRILVERLINTCLVPFELEEKDRMLKLLFLFTTIDSHSSKAFIEAQKSIIQVRYHFKQLVNILRRRNDSEGDITSRLNFQITRLTKLLPNPAKASEFIHKLCNNCQEDQSLLDLLDVILSPTTDCTACADFVNNALKKLGPPVMTNLYYNTIKILLERSSSVLIDKKAIMCLVHVFSEIIEDISDIPQTFGISKKELVDKGSKLISVLACLFPHHFDDPEILGKLVGVLTTQMRRKRENFPSDILQALVDFGVTRPIGHFYPDLMEDLVLKCVSVITKRGTPSDGKRAVKCLHTNLEAPARQEIFSSILESIRRNLDDPTIDVYSTAINALGHIAFLMPDEFKGDVRTLISQKIVKELLVNPKRFHEDDDVNPSLKNEWCEFSELPENTKCMLIGMKATSRWLLGLKTDIIWAQKTLKMLVAFIETGGSFTDLQFLEPEKAWLRLQAGCCMLKICQQKGVGDQFTANQFYALSKLMVDDCEEVRSRFATKLHKGLNRGLPHKCLPLDFMGFYALAGYEMNKKILSSSKQNMISDVKCRREYVKALLLNASDKQRASNQLPHIMPDYMLAFAIPVLTHSPRFTSKDNLSELLEIKKCLKFILDPLATKDDFSFSFYNALVGKIKNCKIGFDSPNQELNKKMYAICDIAFMLLQEKKFFSGLNVQPVMEPRISSMYFTSCENANWTNSNTYIPVELVTSKQPLNRSPARNKRKRESSTKKKTNQQEKLIDAQPTDAKHTRLSIPGVHESSRDETGECSNNGHEDGAMKENIVDDGQKPGTSKALREEMAEAKQKTAKESRVRLTRK